MKARLALAKRVAESEGLTIEQSKRIVDRIFCEIVTILGSGQTLEFRRFGVFEVALDRARERPEVRFRPSSFLTDHVENNIGVDAEHGILQEKEASSCQHPASSPSPTEPPQ